MTSIRKNNKSHPHYSFDLIPMPSMLRRMNGRFVMTAESTLSVDPAFSGLESFVRELLGFDLETSARADISFCCDPEFERESYSLSVTSAAVRVVAGDFSGAFYALQTLRQLFEADNTRGAYLVSQAVEIENDKPRYGWRGLQLDESRHFFGKENVKKLLDYMAMYKLNVFHWHLTDDQGWRIEVKKYPLLTEIGSKRAGTQLHSWQSTDVDMTPYEGFYTQQDIREIVDYAAARSIMIVPEIDFPAHSAAVLAAYNDLACRKLNLDVPYYFGEKIPAKKGIDGWNRPLCLGREEVYSFVYDVIGEIADLFPAPYFHIGGDEAPTEEWEKCADCQRLISALGLENERELQAHFTNCVKDFLNTKGKTLIGWNEILEGSNISRDIVAQYWTYNTDKNVVKHLNEGGKVLLSKHQSFYFDMPYYQVTMRNTYGFEPCKCGIGDQYRSQLLGVEAELWSEWLENFDRVEFALFPRIAALSENAWSSPRVRNWENFLHRLSKHEEFYRRMGITYADNRIALSRNLIWKKHMSRGTDFGSYSTEYDIQKKLK